MQNRKERKNKRNSRYRETVIIQKKVQREREREKLV